MKRIDQLSSDLVSLAEEIKEKRAMLETHLQSVLRKLADSLPTYFEEEMKLAVERNAEMVAAKGSSAIASMKDDLRALQASAILAANQARKRCGQAPHEVQDMTVSYGLKHCEDFFGRLTMYALQELGPILRKHQLIDEYDKSWRETSEGRFEYLGDPKQGRIADLRPASSIYVAQVAELARLKERESKQKEELTKVKVKEMWNES